MTLLSLLAPEQIFGAAGTLAAIAWLALIASPFKAPWSARVRWLAGRLVPLLLALVYVALFAVHGFGDGGYDSLAAVQRLLARPELLTAAWLHFLAFDLFVGSWIAERGGQIGLPHWLIVPLLVTTFWFGPAGLLAYAVVRPLWRPRRAAIAGAA
ncbi:abscisic acid-deficient protein Aba4 family protein [Piscinibacter sakaiensis]|uniref:abscisic acid-deficient protein Aba4 family protein n=1 Tax=Piscinibacter sakaiensis TaxID=1547922 RepID=UPI003AAD71D2